MNVAAIEELQREVCNRYKVAFCPSLSDQKIGIAENVDSGSLMVNGLRHRQSTDTTGWYIWAGETLSNSPDFFSPLHVSHLDVRCPGIKKYLGLPPGWRFLITDKYEDIWFDESLLHS